jgi:hypothetical protein
MNSLCHTTAACHLEQLRLARLAQQSPRYAWATGRERPRLCENTCAVLKSALLCKIRERLINQQTENLRKSAIFVPVLTKKPAPKRFHTVWTHSSRW